MDRECYICGSSERQYDMFTIDPDYFYNICERCAENLRLRLNNLHYEGFIN